MTRSHCLVQNICPSGLREIYFGRVSNFVFFRQPCLGALLYIEGLVSPFDIHICRFCRASVSETLYFLSL